MNKKKYLAISTSYDKFNHFTTKAVIESIFFASSKEEAISLIIKNPINWKEYIDERGELADILTYTFDKYLHVNDSDQSTEFILYEISDQIDLIPLIKESTDKIKSYAKEIQNKQKEKSEFEEYQRLKAKFENE